MTEETENL